MTIKIAHISDLHYESRDPDAASRLIDALKSEQPDYLIVTGDFANNPWKLAEPREFVRQLCKECGLTDSRTFAVAGNHDYRVLGNFGFKPIGRWIFRRTLRAWHSTGFVSLSSSPPITLVFIDSNPALLGFARGRFGYLQAGKLRRLRNRMSKAQIDAMRDSTLIAVMHHHPLPVPHESGDFFLVLKNSQTLVQWLAEIGADIVLHGHKHRATYSGLSIGTSTGRNSVLQVLGAGTCMKANDHDPRGYNFNILTIEQCGLRYVRQFFALAGEAFHELPSPMFVGEAFDDAFERACTRTPYRIRKLHWDLLTDFEGDRLNDFLYSDVVANNAKPGQPFCLPSYSLDAGHSSKPTLQQGAPQVTLVSDVRASREVDVSVSFATPPTAREPVSFRTRSYDYNAVCLDEAEFEHRFPQRFADQKIEEFEEKEISAPVHHFSWTLTFPSDFKFPYDPRFEVLDLSRKLHPWLTETLQHCFQYSESTKTAFLAIRRPPVDYLYRITWAVPSRSPIASSVTPSQKLQLDQFRKKLLFSRGSSPLQIHLAKRLSILLLAFNTLLNRFLSAQLKTTVSFEFDISIMVLDDSDHRLPPSLRVVAGLPLYMQNASFRDFSLEVGDGNAGRAYRKNVVRFYEKAQAKGNPKNHTYVDIPGQPGHPILFSVPLRHPGNPSLVCCMLNIGAPGQPEALVLSALKEDAGNAWLIQAGHEFLLTKLAEECSLKLV